MRREEGEGGGLLKKNGRGSSSPPLDPSLGKVMTKALAPQRGKRRTPKMEFANNNLWHQLREGMREKIAGHVRANSFRVFPLERRKHFSMGNGGFFVCSSGGTEYGVWGRV